jgi:hypothetical protein
MHGKWICDGAPVSPDFGRLVKDKLFTFTAVDYEPASDYELRVSYSEVNCAWTFKNEAQRTAFVDEWRRRHSLVAFNQETDR